MKATISNLKKALKACAKAHNVEFKNWAADGQVGIGSETVPVVSDVRMILEAFYGVVYGLMYEVGWGFVTVYLYDFMNNKSKEVNETLLQLAIPSGVTL